MNDSATSTPIPNSFKIIGILAVVWNLFGVFSFLSHAFFSDQAFADMTDDQVAYMQDFPAWAYVVFGTAVTTGLLGAIGLVMKKKWSVLLFTISLVTILINQFYPILFTNYMEIFGGMSTLTLPVIITAIGALLLWYAKQCDAKEWLS